MSGSWCPGNPTAVISLGFRAPSLMVALNPRGGKLSPCPQAGSWKIERVPGRAGNPVCALGNRAGCRSRAVLHGLRPWSGRRQSRRDPQKQMRFSIRETIRVKNSHFIQGRRHYTFFGIILKIPLSSGDLPRCSSFPCGGHGPVPRSRPTTGSQAISWESPGSGRERAPG